MDRLVGGKSATPLPSDPPVHSGRAPLPAAPAAPLEPLPVRGAHLASHLVQLLDLGVAADEPVHLGAHEPLERALLRLERVHAPPVVDEAREHRPQVAQRDHARLDGDDAEEGGDGRHHEEREDVGARERGGEQQQRRVAQPEQRHRDEGKLDLLAEHHVRRGQLDLGAAQSGLLPPARPRDGCDADGQVEGEGGERGEEERRHHVAERKQRGEERSHLELLHLALAQPEVLQLPVVPPQPRNHRRNLSPASGDGLAAGRAGGLFEGGEVGARGEAREVLERQVRLAEHAPDRKGEPAVEVLPHCGAQVPPPEPAAAAPEPARRVDQP
mmetsp:Transcript_30015/g.95850  ORF Transcript_30015/g.95850 Transcript_30015/m.95850 type:complete len:328 (-) Transcript_30015:1224-2207(-)